MPISPEIGKVINDILNDFAFCEELVDSIEKGSKVLTRPVLKKLDIFQDSLSLILDKDKYLIKALFHYSIDDFTATSSHNFAMDALKSKNFKPSSDEASALPKKARSFFEKLQNLGIQHPSSKRALLSLFQNYVLEQYICEIATEVFAKNLHTDEDIEEVENMLKIAKTSSIQANLQRKLAWYKKESKGTKSEEELASLAKAESKEKEEDRQEGIIFSKLIKCVKNSKEFYQILEMKQWLIDIVGNQEQATAEQGESSYIAFHDVIIDEKPTTIEIVSAHGVFIAKDHERIFGKEEIAGLHAQVQKKWDSLQKEASPFQRSGHAATRRRPKTDTAAQEPETSPAATSASAAAASSDKSPDFNP